MTRLPTIDPAVVNRALDTQSAGGSAGMGSLLGAGTTDIAVGSGDAVGSAAAVEVG